MTQDDSQIQQATTSVGRKIRQLRVRKKLSQQAIADKSGLSRNTLSLIERGHSSPTVSTLKRLAVALDVDISAFFEAHDKTLIIFTKAGERSSLQLSGCTLADLGVGLIEQFVTPLFLRIEPGARSGNVVSHDGQDFVFCLQGEILYKVGDRSFVLNSGDSLLFDAYLEHGFQNSGMEEAELIIVLSTPQDGVNYINSHSLTSPISSD
ncbi:MAG: helix-turn-helix domain-containing protein [Anaerolineales bacterium]|jgi:transcriptional regulator with XRE-family HTH domain